MKINEAEAWEFMTYELLQHIGKYTVNGNQISLSRVMSSYCKAFNLNFENMPDEDFELLKTITKQSIGSYYEFRNNY